jgi:hypothetical protein
VRNSNSHGAFAPWDFNFGAAEFKKIVRSYWERLGNLAAKEVALSMLAREPIALPRRYRRHQGWPRISGVGTWENPLLRSCMSVVQVKSLSIVTSFDLFYESRATGGCYVETDGAALGANSMSC